MLRPCKIDEHQSEIHADFGRKAGKFSRGSSEDRRNSFKPVRRPGDTAATTDRPVPIRRSTIKCLQLPLFVPAIHVWMLWIMWIDCGNSATSDFPDPLGPGSFVLGSSSAGGSGRRRQSQRDCLMRGQGPGSRIINFPWEVRDAKRNEAHGAGRDETRAIE